MKKTIILIFIIFFISVSFSQDSIDSNQNERIGYLENKLDSIKNYRLNKGNKILIDENVYEKSLKVSRDAIQFLQNQTTSYLTLFGIILTVITLLFLVISFISNRSYKKFEKKKEELDAKFKMAEELVHELEVIIKESKELKPKFADAESSYNKEEN